MMSNLMKIVVDIQNILIKSCTVYDMEYRPEDEYFMFRIRKDIDILEPIKNVLASCQSDLWWLIEHFDGFNMENNDYFELSVGNRHETPETYNPVEKAYDILVNGGDVEEAIGYLGEALAD